ncbi:PGR5-like protein 1A, chloroplastic isoform X1 [Zingiber officinale]|uniref:PGR5-like protein 1A, chloroplastic isoform X1 n=1 Tax=Zingiber officinale TaxID=94328 RepID=UPI001C4A88D1|nr:PGR5-like protein 1A, chloroplastic isoform X1 [Zingiber officinale]XP_042394695.1 PGR5-like protein 1A, chloroplastic isoform X1 [Zingiber officinale]
MATPRGFSAHARLMRSSSFSPHAAFRLLHAHPLSARDRLRPPPCGRGRDFLSPARALTADGPSCLYVGPVETATQERLEELYQQARESYYNGNPLIIDDMFDKIELKLRLCGSKSVVKYPRCSLRRHSTYADAEEDPSQEFALASIWLLLLAFGSTAIFVPVIYVISLAFADNISSRYFFYIERSTIGSLAMVNKTLTLVLCYLVGFPLAYASIQALKGLWRSELVAMRGACPNCGEEVFTFVRAESSSTQLHLAHCHVCECALEFQIKVVQSFSRPGRRWVYGRVYLVQQS